MAKKKEENIISKEEKEQILAKPEKLPNEAVDIIFKDNAFYMVKIGYDLDNGKVNAKMEKLADTEHRAMYEAQKYIVDKMFKLKKEKK